MRQFACVVSLLFCASVCADTIIQKDGTVLKGTIISESPSSLSMQLERNGMRLAVTVDRAKIESFSREAPATQPATPATTKASKPPAEIKVFCPIGVWGRFGEDVTAAGLAQAFQEARRVHASGVVLDIDSKGGDVREMEQMLDVIRRTKDLRIVAYVRKDALSAAAILAMACPEIYASPDATIGAAVIVSSPRIPEAVAAKLDSATLARERVSVQAAGHSPLFVDAMADINCEIGYSVVDGTPQLEEGLKPGITPLKRKGKILTMTAAEAVKCGLIIDTISSVDLNTIAALGNPNMVAWSRIGGVAKAEYEAKTLAVRREVRREMKEEYAQRTAPDVERLKRGFLVAQAEYKAASDTKSALRSQYDSEVSTLDDSYRSGGAGLARLRLDDPDRAAAIQRQLDRDYDDRLAVIKQRYQPQIIALDNRINNATRAAQAIQTKLKQIEKDAPR